MGSKIVRAIAASDLSIYDSLADRPGLFVRTGTPERILNKALVGLDLNYPIRTRSKVAKSKICEALGYPVPATFLRTKPRFPGQNFDAYVQKANNLQIWNEEVSASRRYVLIRVDAQQVVTRVRVATGEVIAEFETTGTLTHKYQARSRAEVTDSCLVSEVDAPSFQSRVLGERSPRRPAFMPIAVVYDKLLKLVGTTLINPGIEQERNRGWALHGAVCQQLVATSPSDTGQFPDFPEQLLEIKLQTAPTVDLGLVCPDSKEQIADLPDFRHCDVRYAVFYGTVQGPRVRLDHLVLTTGAEFFTFFRRFEGNVKNAKIQIHLPAGFFD
jgi:hypothetical protein